MKHITLRYVSGLDFNEELDELYSEYSNYGYKSILFHIYSGVLDEELVLSVSRKLSERFSTDQVIGTISAGEIRNGRLMDRGVLISAMLFESADVTVHRFPAASGRESDIGKDICNIADSTPYCKALELLLPGTNLHTKALFDSISNCRRDIQVFGGYAGGGTNAGWTPARRGRHSQLAPVRKHHLFKDFFQSQRARVAARADMHTKLCYQRYAHVVAGSSKSERLAVATSETESILSELIMPR